VVSLVRDVDTGTFKL